MVLSIGPAVKADVKFWCEKFSLAVQVIFLPSKSQKHVLIKKITKFRDGKDLVDCLIQYHYFREWETTTSNESELHLLQSMVFMLIYQ